MTDLLMVIVMLTVLAILLVPALAGPQNKAGRMQCANNLRQIGVASMIYAHEYRGWLPICTVGAPNAGGKVNNLGGMHYTQYIVSAGNFNSMVPTNAVSPTQFDCLGYLYHTGLAGQGQIFYCPDQWGSPLGANAYSPLLTTDAGGVVRGSYAFNPRVVDATNGIIARRYQKTSDLQPHKLIGVDYFGAGSGNTTYPHYREGGYNVLFSEGNVQFNRNARAMALIGTYIQDESIVSSEEEFQILNYLELDH
jgi:hypothetical protein